MKKIMVLLGAVAMMASVQAASVNWSFAATGTTYGGYTVYLTTAASAFTSVADIEKVALGGDASAASGVLVAGTRSSSITGTISGLTAEKAYNFYYVVVKDNDYWTTAQQTVTTAAETASAASVSFKASDGKTLLSGTPTGSFQAIPEPTSGLLLLVGGALLALRRRRA